jgi:hypothetical protein
LLVYFRPPLCGSVRLVRMSASGRTCSYFLRWKDT